MHPLSILGELPSGYVVHEDARGVVVRRADLAEAFEANGFGLDARKAFAVSDLHGRRTLHELVVAGSRYVIRRYHHGGLLRWLTGARFRDPERPFRELTLAARLASLGVRTPPVVAARALSAAGGGWFLDVVSERIEGAHDLGRVLLADTRGEVSLSRRRNLCRAAGRLIARLHALGFVHADLTPRNLLVRDAPDEPELWVLDLDRSTFITALDLDRATDNLRRLHRHVSRLILEGRARLSATDLARFAGAYAPERAERHALVRAIQAGHRRSRGLHRTGWFLERHFGGRGADAH
ncbi:MAG: lipopolysaccharide kinase InaA family protein [Planctomycetes bacterium]|nr:lipopolysaccharide kinase InaA family protein [Planctomycetota bacterium]